MNCEDVRMRLAAYRRSEWSDAEQHAVSEHLTGCPRCRRWEADARGVGEHLRQMPTITPPASLRANVFAAIRREELAAATFAAETAKPVPVPRPADIKLPKPAAPILIMRAANRPLRPAVAASGERLGEVTIGKLRPPRVIFGRSTAIATVAALFLIMFTARFVPLGNLGQIYGDTPASIVGRQLPVFNLTVDASFPKVTSTFANLNQIFYVGQATNGHSMLFAFNRNTSQLSQLLAQPTNNTLTLLALSDQMLFWLNGNADGWMLQAAPIVNNLIQPISTAPIVLAYSGQNFGNSTLAHLASLWVDGQSVLFTAVDSQGMTLLERVDYASGESLIYTFLTESRTGYALRLPYLDGHTAYWVEQSTAADGSPLGTLWHKVDNKPATMLAVGTSAFDPVAMHGAVAWFQLTPMTTSNTTQGAIVSPISGTIIRRADAQTAPQAISTQPIEASDITRGMGYLLWHDAAGMHIYHVDSGESSTNLPILGTGVALSLSPTSMAWATAPAQGVTPPVSTISVFELP